MSRNRITNQLWLRLKSVLPKPKGRHGKNDRGFLEVVCWILKTGAPWRDLPPDYGKWKTVYNRYNNWSKKGYLQSILIELKKKKATTSGTCLTALLLKFTRTQCVVV